MSAAAHYDAFCSVNREGAAFCQGSGVMGDGSDLDAHEPVRVKTKRPALLVQSATNQTCLLAIDGTVSCFGAQIYQLLGNAKGEWIKTPRTIANVQVLRAEQP